ncbi:MAG: DUF3365 domain-containing protein [Chitinophagales bacterium]|nr:DUF3365 domain-containing protein [Chitinophagales bacterium]
MKYTFIAILFLVIACQTKKENTAQTSESTATTVVNDSIAKGKQQIQIIRDSIGANLQNAIENGGTASAIAFCNIEANNIVEATSGDFKGKIKRVSDKPRNPNNQASEAELAFIQACKDSLNNATMPKPKMHYVDDKAFAYYPIVTNNMCMQCHGTPMKDIPADVVSVLQEKYPNDKAINYKPQAIRGLFVVEF